MRALRAQGMVFSAMALLLVAGATLLPRMAPKTEMLIVAVLIVVLGVPHGALDTVFARIRFSPLTRRAWLGFGLRYMGYMAIVVAVWFFAPVAFLLMFLTLSAVHFSGDPLSGSSLFVRGVQGGAVLVLPALQYSAELTTLFSLLVGPSAAGMVVTWLSIAAVPWGIGVILGAAMTVATSKQAALELLAVGILGAAAPPLLAFAVYFCGMHAARHMLRTASYASNVSVRSLALSAAIPMVGVGGAGLVGWLVFGDVQLEVKIIQLLFVGLASLTVPHMMLVEPVRLAGWSDRRA